LIGLAGVVGVLFDGGTEFFHGGSSFFKCAGLGLGTAGEVLVALGDLGAGGGHTFGMLTHVDQHRLHFFGKLVEPGANGREFIVAADGHTVCQIPMTCADVVHRITQDWQAFEQAGQQCGNDQHGNHRQHQAANDGRPHHGVDTRQRFAGLQGHHQNPVGARDGLRLDKTGFVVDLQFLQRTDLCE